LLAHNSETIADTNSLSAGLYETKMFMARGAVVRYRATLDCLTVAGYCPCAVSKLSARALTERMSDR
jgi:hypothetical protein